MMTNGGFEGYDEMRAKFQALMRITDVIENDAAPKVCQVMRKTAATKLKDSDAIDTGTLRASVQAKAAEFVKRKGLTTVEMGIETSVPYAQYIEYGTGPLGDPEVPHTERMTWVYMGDDGKFHVAKSQEPRPFMRPALYDNRQVIKKILEKTIKEVWEQ